ncbi:hypothetical protein GCM10023193_54820 [Planotetraspora kaengkrachanensis]|uniref:Uncharacterized protein n=1 Tax=Planotetraspora kaengkrachanensis TaxID=575193 RepID=A0A8J3PUF3_9ACTN|nr:hypothetical protein Pka01_43670 [Planotetraspora kaengkrachanensis]
MEGPRLADEHDGHATLTHGLHGSRDDLVRRVVAAHGVEGHGQGAATGRMGRDAVHPGHFTRIWNMPEW